MAGIVFIGKQPLQSPNHGTAPTKILQSASQHECNVRNTTEGLFTVARRTGEMLDTVSSDGESWKKRSRVGQAACWKCCHCTQHALNPEMEAATSV